MKIITLDTIDSTNHYLKKLANSDENLPNFLTIRAINQTNGVGQFGAKWETQSSKNLTFSVLALHKKFPLENYFLINMLVSISIHQVLENLEIPKISIKWPNDVLSHRFKIGGVLIENVIRASFIEKSIIGIGLNINQLEFGDLQKASSLKKITGQDFELETLLEKIVLALEENFSNLEQITFEDLKPIYTEKLFRKDIVSAFRPQNGADFSGIIRGITPKGELIVEIEDNKLHFFNLKEVQLLY